MAANDTYRLIVRRGPQPNQTFDLVKDIITVGRDITNDIVINDPEVSRHHLRLTRTNEGYNIEDLGSTNGTFLGGQRLSGVRTLRRGDMLGLGETVTLSYDMARPDAGVAPAASPTPDQQPSPYAPQQQQPPSQPPPQPSEQPPAPQGDYQPPPPQQQGGYGQDQQPVYGQPQPGSQPQYGTGAPPPPQGGDYGYQQGGQAAADYGGPQVPGYEYDPYAIREEEPVSAWRWIVIGCAGMSLFCCCATVIGLFVIDQADLWCDIPLFSDIVTPIFSALGEAFGVIENGGC